LRERARRTHINDIDVLESRQGKVLEDLASEATGSARKGQDSMRDRSWVTQT
jgi:hypothetical protein